MGSITDPVFITISTHTKDVDGTTRNDIFSATTTLSNYTNDLPNFAGVLLTALQGDVDATGGTRTATPTTIGSLSAGGPTSLRAVFQVGNDPNGAFHLTRQAELQTYALATPTQNIILNFLEQNIAAMIPTNTNVWVTNNY